MAKGKDSAFGKRFSEYSDEAEKSRIRQWLEGKPRNTILKMRDGRKFKLGLFGRIVQVK